jgi:hypothetical protein
MNGPSKDAGVERIARALEPFVTFAKEHTDADGWTIGTGRDRICDWFGPSDFQQLLAALLPHPPVDPAAEEVAGRLESMLDGVTSVDTPKDGCVGFMLPDMGYQHIEALGDAAATFIRSMSARIAELEGALAEMPSATEFRDLATIAHRMIPTNTETGRNLGRIGRALDRAADALEALAPSVASETKARAVLGEVERG